MIALIGTALGFFTSFLPKIMDYFQDKQDKKHELAMMDKQLEANKVAGEQKRDMVVIDAEIREVEALHREHARITAKASQWVINLSATVRPVITYAFFLEFVILSVAVFLSWVTAEQYILIWNQETQAIWGSIFGFWFGSRQFGRKNMT